MEVRWTDRQQQVIDLHDRNLLVAAAAGSGKTAVLVERMIQMITNKEHPVDIDRLLVVTFTNAAAAEMRERIGAALEKALREDPSNVHLQSQVTLLHNAQISTIHSFGLSVIRNHFYQIQLDPGFRIGDEREIGMLKEDVLKKVLETAYEEGDPAFLEFVRVYGNTKNDKNIGEMILEFYNYADSYPWPNEVLDGVLAMYQTESVEAYQAQPWMQELLDYTRALLDSMKQRLIQAKELTLEQDGPLLYKETLLQDLECMEQLGSCETYDQLQQALQELSFSALSRKKQDCDSEKKEQCQSIRNDVKKQIKKLAETYFSNTAEEELALLMDEREMMEVLVSLTKAFSETFAEAKAEKNLIDFGDIEHFTLQILVDEKTKQPTETAREYQERFVEVMVDEYQDSNYVQEALLTAVSREYSGENNMFMVGDVKQSIYRFRLARPELFTGKYRAYSTEESKNQRIDLHHNFRSRPEVLDFTNEIFYHIMDRKMGNVDYDDEAALYPGRAFPETSEKDAYQPELILIREDPKSSMDRVELEARITAAKIRQMTAIEPKAGGCSYRDIVILVHAMKGWSDIFLRVFAEEGIPLISTSRSGYFAAKEVQVILQFLKVLNNPRQDIPLAGVLTSKIGTCTPEELAQIKAAFPDKTFYEAVFSWRQMTGEESARIVGEKIADSEQLLAIYEKLQRFFAMADRLRQQVPDTPVHQLIQTIYRETGYAEYVAALPGGERRRANLDMLIELAISYENTSYQGLFDFVRYIEKLLQMELDYGEAELVSEQENAVRMMTIHKSKGLEFPVVFVCGMGKEFNMLGLNNTLLFHPQYGVGMRWMSREYRVRKNVLARQVFGLLERRELLGEEQRLLYVALTRAKDKLILTGVAKDTEEYQGRLLSDREVLSLSERMQAKCFWDWVLPAVYRGGISCRIQEMSQEDLLLEQALHTVDQEIKKQRLQQFLQGEDPNWEQAVAEEVGWKYPHAHHAVTKQKVSVSEIKHRYMDLVEPEETAQLHKEPELLPYVPRFAEGKEEENEGALRGTAMHRFLECFDFTVCLNQDEQAIRKAVQTQLAQMLDSGRLSEKLGLRLSKKQLVHFLCSPVAGQMAKAAQEGNLYREKPFMMSVPANTVWDEADEKETVLIQGIVDVFWVDEDGITLLDYKTDAVTDPAVLVDRYRVQLKLYAQALSRVFDHCPIKDIFIYSFRMESVLSLNETKAMETER